MSPAPYEPFEVSASDRDWMDRIGRLRVVVWTDEGSLARGMFPSGVWLDAFDPVGRHWVACDDRGEIVAAARLTVHARAADSPDGYLWLGAGRALGEPVANIAKLVVDRPARNRGLASRLNRLRIEAAWQMGAAVVTVTASAANARLLEVSGFVDTGLLVQFDNRPGVGFHALELVRPPGR